MKTHLVWFRNDLRVHDNTALHKACLDEQVNILSIFISTPNQWAKHCMSFKQSAFIYENLLSLRKEINKIGIPLYFYQSTNFLNSAQYLINFCKIKKVNSVFYNYQYEINEKNRDVYITTELKKNNISMFGFHDNILVAPNQIKNNNKKTYKIFSYFKNKVIKKIQHDKIKLFSIPKKRISLNYKNSIINFGYPYNSFNESLFPIGENNALNKLLYFIENKVNSYWKKRNFPALNCTSFLSVYLSIGVLSPRQCINSLLKKISLKDIHNNVQSIWLNELIWREFYKHLLIGYPKICTYQSFFSWENKIKWNIDQKKLISWKTGTTGYPMVDAGMRQLKKLGWMHNRMRMITASFLVKNLLINWRIGEEYFMSQLIDGDFSSNNGGWRWIASIGANSLPYFHVINPNIQGKKFDQAGIFIKTYLPELKDIPLSNILNPYSWSKKTGVKINYPAPIVDYEITKKTFLSTYKSAYSYNINKKNK